MSFLNAYFEDKENGGLFHAVSEDWTKVTSTEKHADEQFTAARVSVIGAMLSHDHDTILDAEKAVSQAAGRFEDSRYGGYFRAADKDWKIIKSEKSLHETGELFGVFMHLYEVSKNDAFLLKALDFIDVALDRAWDREYGGFYSLYCPDWKPACDTKDLATQSTMLMHINGSWKDGMDSPYGARSAVHKNKAGLFGALLAERAADKIHGGYYTHFRKDWTPASRDKDVEQLAQLALTLYFHYHNLGPSIWGPRRGSHAFTGRTYPAAYAYRGPAPNVDPVSIKAYPFGKTVVDLGDLLIQHAWDDAYGGFYTTVSETLEPVDTSKRLSTQMNCLLALNVAYRLTGFERFQQKLSETLHVLENKCFDPDNSGAYVSFDRDWQPAIRDKICGPNLMVMGIISMVGPVANGIDVTGQRLKIWVDRPCLEIERDGTGRLVVTVQNQGFDKMRTRIGGLTTPSRWMSPDDIVFELSPHETISHDFIVKPPKEMPPGSYCFEITCMQEGPVADYAAAAGKIVLL